MNMNENPSSASNLRDFSTLVDIIAHLRGPGGCPWDRQQTHESLRESLMEECYEALEAIDAHDPARLSSELGDLLLQILLHSQIAAEAGQFTLADVIEGLNRKLIRRHPHVFGSSQEKTAGEVLVKWEEIKKEERQKDTSMLAGVPLAMPALSYSQEVQARAARVGFDWKDDAGVIEKLAEEVGEFGKADSKAQKEAEFGDILFTLANIARRQGIDLEAALRQANRKFYRRFAGMEKLARERGLDFGKLSFDEQNKLWEEAKKNDDSCST
jgi:tetrapyrrole methylase family protein/MazG family protein